MAKRIRKPYRFQDVKHSIDGIISIGIEVIAIALLVFETILTVRARGEAGGFAGYIGVAALLSSITGLGFAIASWKDEEANDTSKRMGTFLGIVLVLMNLILLILGIAG